MTTYAIEGSTGPWEVVVGLEFRLLTPGDLGGIGPRAIRTRPARCRVEAAARAASAGASVPAAARSKRRAAMSSA